MAVTALVEIAKAPNITPAGIVTEAGTLTDGLEVDKPTKAPPAGAGPDSTTEQVPDAPPVMVPGH